MTPATAMNRLDRQRPTADRRFLSICGALLLLIVAGCRGNAAPPTARTDDGALLVATGGRNPTVADDPHSDVTYVAWAAPREGGAADVFVARVEGEAVSAPVRVNAEAGEAGTHDQAPPQVAVGPDGTVYVAYLVQTDVPGRRFPASELRVARSTDGGRSFEPPVAPHADAGFPTSHHFHDLAVAAAERVREHYNVQARLYALAADKLRGGRKLAGLLFAFVRHGIVVPLRIEDDTLPAWSHWLATLEVQR